MLQSPPLASMLPFHHAMQVAAAQAQAAQHQEAFASQTASTNNSVTSIATSVTSSSPALSGVTSVPNGGIPAVVGGHPTPPGHPPHGHIPPHPFHPASAGLPHGPHGQHPHFHPHLGLEHQRPRFLFKMPRVVPNQKEKYETEDLMKRHSREGEVRFTGYRDRPLHERQTKFICALREGHTEIAFIATGFNVILTFDPTPAFNPAHRQCDYEKEPGKVHIRSPFILNGVCVRWKGYLDLERLDGVGAIEFDEETANLEDAVMRDTVEAYNRRIKDFEEHNKARQRQLAAFMGHQQQVAAALQAQQQLQNNSSSNSTSINSTSNSGSQPPMSNSMMKSPTNNNLISTTSTTSANTHNSSQSLVSSLHSHFGGSSQLSNNEASAIRKKTIHDMSSPTSTATTAN